jgi:hypothetical protein
MHAFSPLGEKSNTSFYWKFNPVSTPDCYAAAEAAGFLSPSASSAALLKPVFFSGRSLFIIPLDLNAMIC